MKRFAMEQLQSWKEKGNIMDKDKKGRPRNGGC